VSVFANLRHYRRAIMTDLARNAVELFTFPSQLARVGLFFALFGSVFAFGFGPDFERPKVWCTCLAAALLLPSAWQNCSAHTRLFKGALALGLAILTLSTLLAIDSNRALLGSLERSQGLLLWFVLVITAIARIDFEALCRALKWVVAILSVWTMMQMSGIESKLLDLVGQNGAWGAAFPGRAFASFGNPNSFAGWLCLAIPILCYEANLRGRARDYAALLAALLMLLLTGTKAAWLAISISAIASLWLQRNIEIRFVKLLFVGLVFLLIGLIIFPPNLGALRLDSAMQRIELWQSSWNSVTHYLQTQDWLRLLLGAGADLQESALNASRVGGLGYFADRAHNAVIDSFLTFGSLGAIGIACAILGKLRRQTSKHTVAVKFSLLAGFLCWQFGFSLTAEKVLLAFLLGSLNGAKHPSAQASASSIPLPAVTFSIALLILSCLSFAPVGCDHLIALRKPEQAYCQFRIAQSAVINQQFPQALLALEQAHNLDPTRADYHRALQKMRQELAP
jgi:hypothetical protein